MAPGSTLTFNEDIELLPNTDSKMLVADYPANSGPRCKLKYSAKGESRFIPADTSIEIINVSTFDDYDNNPSPNGEMRIYVSLDLKSKDKNLKIWCYQHSINTRGYLWWKTESEWHEPFGFTVKDIEDASKGLMEFRISSSESIL